MVSISGKEIKNIEQLQFSQVDGYILSGFSQLKDQSDATHPSKKILVSRNVDIANMNANTLPAKTKNSLELILTTLSRALSIKPITAVGFLTNKNEFLIKGCEKGIKEGGFKPLIIWYDELRTHSAYLSELLIAEFLEFNDPKALADTLSTLSCGLFSVK